MPTIKINPPERLPDHGLTEQLFEIYKTELEVYLSVEEKYHPFLTGGRYANWTDEETNPHRIVQHADPDQAVHLPQRRLELKTFLSLIAKTVSINHYSTIMRNSTSLE